MMANASLFSEWLCRILDLFCFSTIFMLRLLCIFWCHSMHGTILCRCSNGMATSNLLKVFKVKNGHRATKFEEKHFSISLWNRFLYLLTGTRGELANVLGEFHESRVSTVSICAKRVYVYHSLTAAVFAICAQLIKDEEMHTLFWPFSTMQVSFFFTFLLKCPFSDLPSSRPHQQCMCVCDAHVLNVL